MRAPRFLKVFLLSAVCGPAASHAANDPDLLGAWKGTGTDAQWVVNFMPNDTYQFRLGDSPTGSRGEYAANNGKLQLFDGGNKSKALTGGYRVEDCNVLVLTLPNGTARMNRRGTVPTGGCGKHSGAAAKPATPTSVLGSIGGTAAGPTPVTPASARQSPGSVAQAGGSVRIPDPAQSAASAKAGAQKSAQQSATAAKATVQQAATQKTAEGTDALKSGASAFWNKAKSLSKSAVQAGGKAAKTVGHKAQEAGHAVANKVRKAGEADEAEAKPDP
jgi:hypothetical protein